MYMHRFQETQSGCKNALFWHRRAPIGSSPEEVPGPTEAIGWSEVQMSRCGFDKHLFNLRTLVSHTLITERTLQRHEALKRNMDEQLERIQGPDCGSGQWDIYDGMLNPVHSCRH